MINYIRYYLLFISFIFSAMPIITNGSAEPLQNHSHISESDTRLQAITPLTKKVRPQKLIKNEIFTKQINYRISFFTDFEWQDINWKETTRIEYEYNQNGLLIRKNLKEWAEGTWVLVGRFNFNYDENSRLIGDTYQYWYDGEWLNIDRYVYKYDEKGNQTEKIYQEWLTSGFQNVNREIYTYNSNGEQNSGLFQTYFNGNWIDDRRWIKTFDQSNVLIETLVEQSVNGIWTNQQLTVFMYEFGSIKTELIKKWLNDEWINNEKLEYNYDGGYLSSRVFLLWQDDTWVQNEQIIYNYDINGNLVEEKYQFWTSTGWSNDSKRVYTYKHVSNVNKGTNTPLYLPTDLKLNNYPNPFNSGTTIRFDLETKSAVSVSIYDIKGQHQISLLMEKFLNAGSHEIKWNGMNQRNKPTPSGIYFIIIESDKFSITHKCLLLR